MRLHYNITANTYMQPWLQIGTLLPILYDNYYMTNTVLIIYISTVSRQI